MNHTQTARLNIFDSIRLLPCRRWKTLVLRILLIVFVAFLAEISDASANGLFDFQMKLAEKGNAEAQFKIGEMYETGFGTKKDLKLAEEWIAKAASQGHETAGFKQLYWDMQKNGLTKTNTARYQELVTKANADNAYAQYYVGKLYAEGTGVKKDSDKALDWFNKATLQGVVEAERESAIVRDKIKREELELARQKAAQQRQAALKAQHDAEKRQQEAATRAAAAQKKAEAERAAKQEADKRNQAAASKKANDDKSRQAQAAEDAKRAAAEQRALEAKRKALLEQREAREAKRKAEFESDPCSGKSARFLSTCR